MPKGARNIFGRRKSNSNALDEASAAAPAQSSFKVLERPDKRSTTSYGAQERSASRQFDSPLSALRGKSVDNLGLGVRGSAGTTNSGASASSGYYDSSASAKHSSTSTLPSSLDPERDEELFPPVQKAATTGMYQTVAPSANEPLPPPPSFSTRAARALSFGKQSTKKNSTDEPPPVPAHYVPNGYPSNPPRSHSPVKDRERAMTTSSYASTAVPPRTELTLNSTDFGDDDFGSMFDTVKKENPLPPPPAAGSFHRTDSQPMYPPRTYSRQALTPSPNALRLAQSTRDQSESPYYSDDRSSNEGLMSSSAMSSPNIPDGTTPEPPVGNGITKNFLGNAKSGYSLVPERYNSPGPERASIDSYSSAMGDEQQKEQAYPQRQAQVDDEDRWVKRVELRDPQGPTSSSPARAGPSTRQPYGAQASAGASRIGAVSPNSSTDDSYERAESNTTTPRAARGELRTVAEAGLFDSSPVGPPSRAVRPAQHQRSESGTTKRMTKAQFQALQKRGESSGEQSEEEDMSAEDYDDEDDGERAKQMASQRRKQEANMSVYRQQMKKVTGGGPTDLPSSAASTVRPSMDRGSSAPAAAGGIFHFGGIGGTPPADAVKGKLNDDEDDDVPLGILQAHGFPSSSRPPTRLGENDINHQRRTSVAGSVVGGGAGQGPLPPFARRLPADPYFGAGLVNQSTRESLAMNSSGASVVGMPTGQMTPQGHPGGLVGVIAGEERARAARRGSPNPATGSYNMPLPANMNMPQMPRTMSMGNVMPPQMFAGAPQMPQMPQMPNMMGMPQMPQGMMDPGQQQMQQFMQMQMQLMQNMIAMQQAQMGQTPQPQQPQQVNDYLGVNFNNMQRPMSMASQQSSFAPNAGRSMTMMNPPSGWGQPAQSASRPTSALPRGVSTYAPSMSGLNLGGGGPGPGYTPSIAPSERSNVGMPTRYRPVTQLGDGERTNSMTSSMTLQAFAKQQTSPNLPGTPFNGTQAQTPKSTIRIIDKPKGAAKAPAKPADEDDDDAWADMKKKREEKKKSKWSLGRKDKTASATSPTTTTGEQSLSELYKGLD